MNQSFKTLKTYFTIRFVIEIKIGFKHGVIQTRLDFIILFEKYRKTPF